MLQGEQTPSFHRFMMISLYCWLDQLGASQKLALSPCIDDFFSAKSLPCLRCTTEPPPSSPPSSRFDITGEFLWQVALPPTPSRQLFWFENLFLMIQFTLCRPLPRLGTGIKITGPADQVLISRLEVNVCPPGFIPVGDYLERQARARD